MENVVPNGNGSIIAPIVATADVLNLNFKEFDRLKTYPRLWSHRFTKRELARNGFHYIHDNLCKCAFCECHLILDPFVGSIEQLHQQLCATCDFAFQRDEARNIPMGDVSDYR